MILENPKEAVGHKVRYYSWEKSYMIVEGVDSINRKIYGTMVTEKGSINKGIKYNLCKGITTGEKIYDYWCLVDYQYFGKLPDELFEI